MKNLLFSAVLLISGTLLAQENPKEVKQETEVTTVKTNHGNKISAKSVKVVTKETSDIKLDKSNQDRVKSDTKVEKEVYVDNDDNTGYQFLTKETYFISDGGKYAFSPNDKGFGINFNPDNATSIESAKSWASSNDDYYIVEGETHSGIGRFNTNGDFVVEYYNKDTQQVEVKIYKKN
ncbi:hypothetical protein MWU78_16330 [Arenibacter sp. F26102]|uniref:hypothetical protein n=1 Tax=Arenibacter sp. F26102 TaxID=2926416 RepID=UPI001FF6A76E|nr:hypothetical protein [Arenibacter sp. F26102]MCK0147227.1 hypothetical protein [Arenibacter sp. F26102]